MSREIKFRVWDIQSNFYWGMGEGMEFKKIAFNFYDELFTHDKLIFQQFTGLKDKNGKEIYEGDIIKSMGSKHLLLVDFDSGSFVFRKPNINPKVGVEAIRPYYGSAGKSSYDEVLGNIFENPELLKKS